MEQLQAFKLRSGDQIVGFSEWGVVTGYRYVGESDLGSTRERQHFTVSFTNGREMTVNADHKFGVIR